MAPFEAVLEHVWGSPATREEAEVGGRRPPTFPRTCSLHLRTILLIFDLKNSEDFVGFRVSISYSEVSYRVLLSKSRSRCHK